MGEDRFDSPTGAGEVHNDASCNWDFNQVSGLYWVGGLKELGVLIVEAGWG